MLALGATIVTNKRRLKAEEFFQGLFTTALESDEIITKVMFPVPKKAAYVKFRNQASRYALVGVFVAKRPSDVRVAVTGAGSEGVFRVTAFEEALKKRFSPKALDGLTVPAEGLNSDLHGSAEYRAHLIAVLARRAVEAATAKALTFQPSRSYQDWFSMTASALPTSVDAMLELLTSRGYLAERSLATVTYLSLRMGRPLFLEGEAGVGKTEIAKVLSAALGRKLIRLQCYEGLDVASAVYEWNSAAQMIAIRLAEAAGDTDREQLSSDIFAERYLIKRPLLQALEPDVAGAPVLLIDELDRADEAFEAYLLEILSDFQVTHPRTRHREGAASADRHHHLEPHPRNPRRAEAPLSLSLGGLSHCRARTCDRQVARAGHFREVVAAGRPLRAGAARSGFLQVAGRRRDHRLGHRADRTRRPLADAAGGRRHARRAVEIPGRYRADAGRHAAEGFERGDERELARSRDDTRHSGARDSVELDAR